MEFNKGKVLSELTGLGSGGGRLEKLRIITDEGAGSEETEALFNPQELSLSRQVTWAGKSVFQQGGGWTWVDVEQQFREVQPETLTIDLFFDTYESSTAAGPLRKAAALATPTNPFQDDAALDVREYTRKVARLAVVAQGQHHPPICELHWGSWQIFTGVLTSLTQKFTMFHPDGRPVRANLTCGFTEFTTGSHQWATQSTRKAVRTRQVKKGDTLQKIAQEEYGTKAGKKKWRHIAEANGLGKAHRLQPGAVLKIPK